MGQMRKPPTATSGPKMTDEEIHRQVTDYSSGYKPKPTGQSKSQKVVASAFHEVFHNTPAAVTKTAAKSGPVQAQKQRVAIALSKARAAGARIPKAPRGK
jgi:Family of unknown function (DUF6496)